ncbi:MAG TPA: hypothetical protein VK507_06705, partial [Iamia sp.]|nr:hypothetical protein [Iamia sp.]
MRLHLRNGSPQPLYNLTVTGEDPDDQSEMVLVAMSVVAPGFEMARALTRPIRNYRDSDALVLEFDD